MNIEATEKTYKDVLLTIPFLGYKDALNVGYEKAVTSCGMCCIAMILSSKDNNVHLVDLIHRGHADGGYSENGWVHDYFVKLLSEYSLPAIRKENIPRQNGVLEIKNNILKGKPVIVSGRKLFMDQTSFHMVLIVGVQLDNQGNCAGFYYHDPAILNKITGSYRFVSIDQFQQYWRQMAIMLE